MVKRSVFSILALLFSFYLGFVYANYQWQRNLIGSMTTIQEQASVEHALIYMDKYLAGNIEEAHSWISDHAFSDPEWNLNEYDIQTYLFGALKLPSAEGLEQVRLNHLEKIRTKQVELEVKLK